MMSRLQSIKNAAARLVTGTWRSDHITPVLRLLHWLSVRQRVDFKVFATLTTVFLLPMLVCSGYAPQRAEHTSLHGPTACDRAFAVVGLGPWNSLSSRLSDADLT